MKIYSQTERLAAARITRRSVKTCVVGVGTIGLPLAVHLAKSGFNVVGYDINREHVNRINAGDVTFEYADLLKGAIKKKRLHATADANEAVSGSEMIILCIPTPLDKTNRLNLAPLQSAARAVSSNLGGGELIVVESSVAVGTTREIGNLIEGTSGLRLGKQFGLAYCPERYNPGLPREWHPYTSYRRPDAEIHSFTLTNTPRVVGGIDPRSRRLAMNMYSTFVSSVTGVASIEVAEASKLLENIFRDVNIALANELSRAFARLGLSMFDVIDAAKTKPFAFLPHYPGPGVGGECIPVDSWYLINQAEAVGEDTTLLRAARKVNDLMPRLVAELLELGLDKVHRDVNGSRILILGIAYKKNVIDTRLSPALALRDILTSEGAEVRLCDPLVATATTSRELIPVEDAFEDCDAAILVTDHDVFRRINLSKEAARMRNRVIVDGRNFFSQRAIRASKVVYLGIGRPVQI